MKCVLCNQRKAKRSCPAKNHSICTVCCGEKRVLEIDCPESCEYLRIGREYESVEYSRRLYRLDKDSLERSKRVLGEHLEVVASLEYALSHERRLSRELTDGEAGQAIGILLETYKTEANGILYERTSENLRVESLRRGLREVIESFRNRRRERGEGLWSPGKSGFQLSAAIDCLEFIQSMINAYSGERQSASAYLDFLARTIPGPELRNIIVRP